MAEPRDKETNAKAEYLKKKSAAERAEAAERRSTALAVVALVVAIAIIGAALFVLF